MIGVGEAGPVRDHAPDRASERDREALAVLVSVEGVGPVTLERLVLACGGGAGVLELAAEPGGAAALETSVRSLGDGRPLPDGLAEAIAVAAGRREAILERLAGLDLRVIVATDAEYPARLRTIEMPPAALFVRGDPRALNGRHATAVVGTRRPSDAGRRIAARVGAALARAGSIVVSGLAVGVDGAAHAAVVEAGGRTVAFIGGGHARLFPFVHDRLAEAIVAGGGAVVSEYAPDVEPTRGTFPRRNRLISGSADAVVVVEAGARSGALLTASWALEQGRECFLVPGSIESPTAAGCLGFLRDWPGAARIVAGVPQLLDDLGLPAEAALLRPAPILRGPVSAVRPPSAGSALKVLGPPDEPVAIAVARGAATVDELAAVTHLTVPVLLTALTRLEAAGLVRGRYGRYAPAGALAQRAPPRAAPRTPQPGARAAPAAASGGRTSRRTGRAAMPPAA